MCMRCFVLYIYRVSRSSKAIHMGPSLLPFCRNLSHEMTAHMAPTVYLDAVVINGDGFTLVGIDARLIATPPPPVAR